MSIKCDGKEDFKLLKRMQGSPTAEDRDSFRQLALKCPDLPRSMTVGPLIRAGIIESLTSSNALLKESLLLDLEAMERELDYQGSQGLERLLVENVLTSWMVLQQVQHRVYSIGKESHTLAVGTYWDKRLNSAQWRFLKASEMLARMRKMLGPMVQVNVAEKQVNVAG